MFSDLWTDLRYAGSALRRSPGFTALAVLVMALGIGANTAVFSVVSAVLLKPLPYPDSDRIVTLFSDYGLGSFDQVTIADFRDWRAQSTSFEAMATYRVGNTPVTPGVAAEYARTAVVDPDFLRVFGVQPILGRVFTRADVTSDDGVALISYAYWQSHFGGDPGVVSRSIRVNTNAWSIVGVLPRGFAFPDDTDVWLPERTQSTSRTGRNFGAVARLAPGVSLGAARTELKTIAARLEQQFPDSNKGRSAALVRLQDRLVRDVRLTLYVLWGVVGIVLLIACANTATLLLGKAAARMRELAVRAALGATRGRIVRQFLAESLLLALAGGAAGTLLAYGGAGILVALAPFDVVRDAGARIDAGALAFTLVVSLATSLVFGILPALHASKVDVSEALKQEGSRSVTAGRAIRTRGVLVTLEIALAVMLLTGAGLLIKTLVALTSVDLGFRPENVLVMRATGVRAQDENDEFFRQVLSRIGAIPGVVAVGATSMPPGDLSTSGSGSYFVDRKPEVSDRRSAPQSFFTVLAPGTFAALGVPVTRGRDFTAGDSGDRALVAIVNEELVRRSLPGQDPIGRGIFCNFDRDEPMMIVGVVGNVRQVGPASEPIPECFLPYQQHTYNGRTLHVVIRTAGDPTALTTAVRRAAREVSAEVPVSFTTMEATIADRVEDPRFRALLFAVLAGLAVCLAVAGVYGVMAYSVKYRTQEIGLRMALGATPRGVLRLVLGQAMVLAAIGLVVGLAGSALATRLLTTVLFEVQPFDLPVYVGVIAVVGLIGATAGFLPARRAAVVSPMVAIRDEGTSLLRAAGETIRQTVRGVTQVVAGRHDADLSGSALLTEFAAAARQADSFTGALAGALSTLCDRLGADSGMLLERSTGGQYRTRVAVGRLEPIGYVLPESGFLVSRLAAHPVPLAFTHSELQTIVEWTAENRPARLDEVKALADAHVRMAVPLRTRDELAGILLLGPRDSDRIPYGAAEKEALRTCADHFALMIENAALTDRVVEQETLRRDLALAVEVQRRLLPAACPSGGAADFAAVSVPARSIGGDYYDFIEAGDHRIGIALADVSGKGIAAALIMSVVQASLRIIASDVDLSLPCLAAKMNEFLYRTTPGNRYATFFYAQLDSGRRQLRYVNAGHNPPYLIRHGTLGRSDGTEGYAIQELSAGGAVIGMLPGLDYEEAVVDLCPGDVVLVFTDGVTEAHNPENEEFGEQRVQALLRETAHLPVQEISARITHALSGWTRDAPQYDDVTFVVMKIVD
jgi:predicted permease